MRKISAVFIFLLLYGATPCWAYTDFYGVKMRSVSNVKDFVIEPTPDNSLKYTHNAGTMDDRVRAWARLQHTGVGRSGVVKLTVENLSDKPILSELTFAEFFLVMANGDRHPLNAPVLFGALPEISPGKKAKFSPSFGSLVIKQTDVKMIVCSFDMGDTLIVLVPRPYAPPEKKPGTPLVVKEAARPAKGQTKPPKPVRVRTRDDATYPAVNFALPKANRREKHVR